jgi:hypothetical protein
VIALVAHAHLFATFAARFIDQFPGKDGRIVLVGDSCVFILAIQHVSDPLFVLHLSFIKGEEVIMGTHTIQVLRTGTPIFLALSKTSSTIALGLKLM